MSPYYQRLKELDPNSFEKLCFQLLNARHPTASIRSVDGVSGDQGVDLFFGDLHNRPTIWQIKAFPNGIRKSQKEQIRQSLKAAVKHFSPSRWVLCININMDIHAHRWFQNLQKSYLPTTEVGLMQAADIVAELAHRRTIANLFFPDAALNVAELRALAMRTSDLTEQQLAALSQETAQQLIERIKQIDARWDYEIVTSPDRASTSASGATFSVSHDGVTINAYSRDIEAIRLDPPTVTFALKGTGIDKMMAFQKTGHESSFGADELEAVSTNLPTFSLFKFEGPPILRIGPSKHQDKKVPPLRLTFGSGSKAVTYEYMVFRFERGGSDEVEIVSELDTQIPFTLSLVVNPTGVLVTFYENLKGASILAVDKYLRAISALRSTREIEAYNLQAGKRYFLAKLEGELPMTRIEQFQQFFAYAARVCAFFRVDLKLNRDIMREDVDAVEQLAAIANGITQLERIQGTLVKSSSDDVLAWHESVVDLQLDHAGLQVSILDTNVSTGPFRVQTKVRLADSDRVRSEWMSISVGGVLDVEWQPVGESMVVRL